VTFCLALISCSTPRPTGKTEAEVLFKEAQDLVKQSRFILATEKLNTLRSQYPYSFYATHAELLQADVLFKQENFVEAAAAYILFKDFHPKHDKKAYVNWRIAESFYAQIPDTFDRDLSAAHEAVKYYQELLNYQGDSEYAKGAIDKVKMAQQMILDKEKYIGDFYFKTEVYDAARYRYLAIIDKFRNSPDLISHSMIRVIESSHKLKDKESCTKYFSSFKPLIDQSKSKKLKSVYDNCLR
jgi:outer membrane protein assembly factor BamD